MKVHQVDTNLQRSPLNSSSQSLVRKHGRVEEDLVESMPLLKRCKLGLGNGLSEVLVDDDSGVCSDDNLPTISEDSPPEQPATVPATV